MGSGIPLDSMLDSNPAADSGLVPSAQGSPTLLSALKGSTLRASAYGQDLADSFKEDDLNLLGDFKGSSFSLQGLGDGEESLFHRPSGTDLGTDTLWSSFPVDMDSLLPSRATTPFGQPLNDRFLGMNSNRSDAKGSQRDSTGAGARTGAGISGNLGGDRLGEGLLTNITTTSSYLPLLQGSCEKESTLFRSNSQDFIYNSINSSAPTANNKSVASSANGSSFDSSFCGYGQNLVVPQQAQAQQQAQPPQNQQQAHQAMQQAKERMQVGSVQQLGNVGDVQQQMLPPEVNMQQQQQQQPITSSAPFQIMQTQQQQVASHVRTVGFAPQGDQNNSTVTYAMQQLPFQQQQQAQQQHMQGQPLSAPMLMQPAYTYAQSMQVSMSAPPTSTEAPSQQQSSGANDSKASRAQQQRARRQAANKQKRRDADQKDSDDTRQTHSTQDVQQQSKQGIPERAHEGDGQQCISSQLGHQVVPIGVVSVEMQPMDINLQQSGGLNSSTRLLQQHDPGQQGQPIVVPFRLAPVQVQQQHLRPANSTQQRIPPQSMGFPAHSGNVYQQPMSQQINQMVMLDHAVPLYSSSSSVSNGGANNSQMPGTENAANGQNSVATQLVNLPFVVSQSGSVSSATQHTTSEMSAEEAGLAELEAIIAKLDPPTMNNIKESLYRLAQSARLRGGSSSTKGQPAPVTDKTQSLVDRSVANLLYHRYTDAPAIGLYHGGSSTINGGVVVPAGGMHAGPQGSIVASDHVTGIPATGQEGSMSKVGGDEVAGKFQSNGANNNVQVTG